MATFTRLSGTNFGSAPLQCRMNISRTNSNVGQNQHCFHSTLNTEGGSQHFIHTSNANTISLYRPRPNPTIVQEDDKVEGEDPDIIYRAINEKEKETDGRLSKMTCLWGGITLFQVIQCSAGELTSIFLPCEIVKVMRS